MVERLERLLTLIVIVQLLSVVGNTCLHIDAFLVAR